MSASKHPTNSTRRTVPHGPGKTRGKLTAQQDRFCHEYLIDLKALPAAIRAGYSERSAKSMAYQLLRKPWIAARIDELRAARAKRTEISADRVIRELALIGFANADDFMGVTMDGDPYIDVSKLSREQRAAIAEFAVEDYVEGRGEDARSVRRVKIKLWDKRAALVDIGRHLGMFNEKLRLEDAKGDPLATLYREIVGAPGARSIISLAHEAARDREVIDAAPGEGEGEE